MYRDRARNCVIFFSYKGIAVSGVFVQFDRSIDRRIIKTLFDYFIFYKFVSHNVNIFLLLLKID